MADGEKCDRFDAFADDLVEERSVRPLIIIGASKVDDLLREVLTLYLLPKLAKEDDLLDGDRPLSTFSARIKLCYRLGLIDKSLYIALEKLRCLRNACAHGVTFNAEKSPLRDHLSDFRRNLSGRSSFTLTRNRYFETRTLTAVEEIQCLLLTVCVLLEAIRETTSVTNGHEKSLRIAAN